MKLLKLFRQRYRGGEVVVRSAIEAMDVCAHGVPIATRCQDCVALTLGGRCRHGEQLLNECTACTAEWAANRTDWSPEDRVTLTTEGFAVTNNDDENARYRDPDPADAPDAEPPVAGRRPAPRLEPAPEPPRDACPHCRGTGKTLTTNDLLRESLELIGEHGDDVVREFYARLVDAAPDLAPLFPADLTDPLSAPLSPEDSQILRTGRGQRDKLLAALVALGQMYDPTLPDQMEVLDTHLAAFGRSHARFARPDGTEQGATLAEYAAVKSVLFGTLSDFGGDLWLPAYTAAWSEAYDYAAGAMLFHAHRSGVKSARYAR